MRHGPLSTASAANSRYLFLGGKNHTSIDENCDGLQPKSDGSVRSDPLCSVFSVLAPFVAKSLR